MVVGGPTYDLVADVSNNLVYCFATVGTEFAVAIWIWSSLCKNKNDATTHRVDVTHHWFHWVVGVVNFAALMLPMLPDSVLADVFPVAFPYTAPVFVVAGICLLLFFFWCLDQNKGDGLSSNAKEEHAKREDECCTDAADLLESSSSKCTSEEEEEEKKEDKPEAKEIISSNRKSPSMQKSTKKPNLAYINNIKIFLTMIVILHHSAMAFALKPLVGVTFYPSDGNLWSEYIFPIFINVNQSYFMALFFFFSGYFTPRSLDRKGRRVFLMERFRRLGIPFVLSMFLLDPYLSYGLSNQMFSGTFYVNKPVEPGVSWFLAQLLVMNTIYAFACGRGWSPRLSYPGLKWILPVAYALGIVIGVICLWLPPSSPFLGTNGFWSIYPMYLLFFFSGGLAQRNNWMEHLRYERAGIWFRVIIYVFCLLDVAFQLITLLFPSVTATWSSLGTQIFTVFYVSVIATGLPTVAWSLGVTIFFMDFLNRSFGRVTEVLTKSMYTAYIIQLMLPLQLALYIFVAIYNAASREAPLIFTIQNSVQFIPGNLIFPAWLFVSFLELAVLWPFAYAIRSIPGFSRVL